jgi:accessory colonization factor AcfC
MSAVNLLTAFNDHFAEFVTDIQNVFPEDTDVLTAKNSLLAIRKANPKMIVKIWSTFIVGKYQKEIEQGDISFFITKDYSQDVAGSKHPDRIVEAIDRLREPIKQMSPESQAKTMKYIQNLTKLALLCEKI